MEEIINSFTKELESDAKIFFEEAKRINEYDVILRASQDEISQLSEQVSALLFQQKELDRTLTSVDAYHSEVNSSLDKLENHLDELFTGHGGLRPEDADVERERAYQTAIDIGGRLNDVNTVLNTVVGDLNGVYEREEGQGEEDLGSILGILNAHYETLSWLEGSARSVEEDVANIGRVLGEV